MPNLGPDWHGERADEAHNLELVNRMLDLNRVSDVEVDGIDMKDYPDFVDAFISAARYDGEPMTDAQLDQLNENADFVYEAVMRRLY